MHIKSILIPLAICLIGGLATQSDRAVAEPGQRPDQRQMLSRHETVAEFGGIHNKTCMGLTSLCPDRCGHSGRMAVFAIRTYLAYEKPGQYGDPQQHEYAVLIEDNRKQLKIPAAQHAQIEALKKGEFVLLNWQHDYVTRQGSSFPERTITKLERITPDEAAKHIAGGTVPPAESP